MRKILPLIMIACILLTGCVRKELVSDQIGTYPTNRAAVHNAAALMPDTADLGSYAQIRYTYQVTCYSRSMEFYSDGLALFVKYDEDTYALEKNRALRQLPIRQYENY